MDVVLYITTGTLLWTVTVIWVKRAVTVYLGWEHGWEKRPAIAPYEEDDNDRNLLLEECHDAGLYLWEERRDMDAERKCERAFVVAQAERARLHSGVSRRAFDVHAQQVLDMQNAGMHSGQLAAQRGNAPRGALDAAGALGIGSAGIAALLGGLGAAGGDVLGGNGRRGNPFILGSLLP